MGLVAMNGKTLTAPTTSYAATIARQTLIFQTAMSQKTKSTLRSIVIIAIIILAAYFLSAEYQSQLEQKAIDTTGLEALAFQQAIVESSKIGKPVLADLSAIWCPSSPRIDTEVLTNEMVKSKTESDYVFALIEYESDEGAEFIEKYQFSRFPSLHLLDGQVNKLKNLLRIFSPKHSWRPFKRLSNYPQAARNP